MYPDRWRKKLPPNRQRAQGPQAGVTSGLPTPPRSLPAFMSHPATSSLDAEREALPQQCLSAHVPGVWRAGALSSMQVNLG